MTNMLKVTLIAAAAALTIGSSAFAQSYAPEAATRNVSSPGYGYKPVGTRSYGASDREGLNAYAMQPSPGSVDSPALTGGGSLGYNERLRKDY